MNFTISAFVSRVWRRAWFKAIRTFLARVLRRLAQGCALLGRGAEVAGSKLMDAADWLMRN